MRLTKRIARLEAVARPQRQPRVVIRYEWPGSEDFLQPSEEELDENDQVVVVRFVESNWDEKLAESR